MVANVTRSIDDVVRMVLEDSSPMIMILPSTPGAIGESLVKYSLMTSESCRPIHFGEKKSQSL